MLPFSVHIILIIAIYCDGVFLLNETDLDLNGVEDDDFTQKLVIHAASMLCDFRVNLVYVYYETTLRTNIAENMIFLLNRCTALTIARYLSLHFL